jgi:hypothetical protein
MAKLLLARRGAALSVVPIRTYGPYTVAAGAVIDLTLEI